MKFGGVPYGGAGEEIMSFSCAVLPCGHAHDFQETYYGWTCTNCGLFYAFGTAPWEDEDDPLSDYGDTNEKADRG